MSLEIEPVTNGKHGADVVDRFLLAWQVTGSSIAAAHQLKAEGIDIDDSTGRRMKMRYPGRWQSVAENHHRAIEDHLVASQRTIAQAASAKALEGIEEIDFSKIDQRDRPRAVQALETSAAIATDKTLALTGRPVSVVEHRDYRQVLERYGGKVLSSDDVVDAEVVELPKGDDGV